MKTFKGKWAVVICGLLLTSMMTLAHDPRTTSKDFSAGMIVGGAGKFEITYKGMHWNGPSYEHAMSTESFRANMNKSVWSALGKAHLDFDVIIGGHAVPRGDYVFGILLEPDRKFTLSLANSAQTVTVPLETTFGNPDHPYLSVDLSPVDAMNKPDLYVFEARCGQFRGTQSMQVPYLMEHKHPEEGMKPAEHTTK